MVPETHGLSSPVGDSWESTLVAVTGQVLRPIVAIGPTNVGFSQVFSSTTCYKKDRGDVKAPNNIMGMTYI